MIPFDEPTPIETAPQPPMEPTPSKPKATVSPAHKTPGKEAKPSTEKSVQAKQEVLQFEAVTRGRFEKSEPTIVEGEDLDVPTYLRKNIKVK
jgi:cell division protein FtsZ